MDKTPLSEIMFIFVVRITNSMNKEIINQPRAIVHSLLFGLSGTPLSIGATLFIEAMKLIPTTRGLFAQVDDEDYEYLSQFKWAAWKGKKTFYANRSIRRNRRTITFSMHRIIMNTPKGLHVDHIDHNGLNNQKSNLRNCTRIQNNQNCAIREGKRFKGITHETVIKKNGKRYEYITARIAVNGKDRRLGYFKTEEAAARAYDNAAKLYYGEFACLNFNDKP